MWFSGRVSTVSGVSAMLGSVLKLVPLSVLFGVFLYMGVSSLAGIQFLDRVKLFFMPVKHHPMVQYIRRVSVYTSVPQRTGHRDRCRGLT